MKLLNTIKLLITVENRNYKMKFYCVKCRKDTKNINPKILSTSNDKSMISKYAICGSKKQDLLKIKQKDYQVIQVLEHR